MRLNRIPEMIMDQQQTRISRTAIAALAAAVVFVGIIVVLLVSRRTGSEEIAARVDGDVAEIVEGMDVDEMPDRAAAFLATDRPWRAAQVMRSYMRRVSDAPADHRLLAARAEAGWEAWPEVATLLENVRALDTYENGIGLYLLARARDHAGDAPGAVESYRAFLALSPAAGELQAERAAARLRLGLALIRAGDRAASGRELQVSRSGAGGAARWIELLEADALARTGDTAAVRHRVAGHSDGVAGLRAWRARIDAAQHAGDIAQARVLANQARTWARTDGSRAEFYVRAARAAIELGDVAAGRGALRAAIALSAAGPAAREAAELLAAGTIDAADHLAVARVYRAQGLHEESIDHYRRWIASRQGSAAERTAVHMEHANALFYAERYDDVPAALRPIAGATATQMLLARNEAHRGNIDEAVRLYLAEAQRHAGNANGAQALFLAAGTRHEAGDLQRARELYQRVVAQYPGRSQAGLSMMRLAGIAFLQENYAEAARIWDQYRTRFPRGTHAHESTYWAARARDAAGDSAGAAALYRTARAAARDSYYALRASERLGVPFWPLPMSAAPADDAIAARRVAGWMQGIDLLRTAGFHDEASAEADRVVAGAGADRATRYALAEALIERGYSQRALRIGLALQGSGAPDRRLLRILYAFPYRTLITEEARDRGFDPFVASALIRQESMFEARITSHVGARGLMQIMPATGRRLAQAAGIDRWDDELLYQPEINVHLGTRYLAQHMENYDNSLPSVFSAYNAGSHRVEWWKEFPEYGNEELFTERIPFRETRDYVKILTRNHAVYRGLYGGQP
jgi:soluble lytic murein transglycosylase